jgi:hypothetical protein
MTAGLDQLEDEIAQQIDGEYAPEGSVTPVAARFIRLVTIIPQNLRLRKTFGTGDMMAFPKNVLSPTRDIHQMPIRCRTQPTNR